MAQLPPEPPHPDLPLRASYMTVAGTGADAVYAVRTYDRAQSMVAKEAGASWHGPHDDPRFPASACAACKAGLPLRDWWYFLPRRAEMATKLAGMADERAREALGGALARTEGSRAADARPAVVGPIPAPPGMVYRPFQLAGIAFMRGLNGALLADEPGLGKTIQVLGLINAEEDIRRALVVVPANLRINWAREATKWLVRPTHIHVISNDEKLGRFYDGCHHVLTSGPSLPRGVSRPNVLVIVNYDRARDEVLRDALMEKQWDLLAADEAHALKNPRARRTLAVLGQAERRKAGKVLTEAEPGIRSRADRFIAMTGTPIPNKPIEIFPLLQAVCPTRFSNFIQYAYRYCGARKEVVSQRTGQTALKTNGASNLEELQTILRATCMVRRLKGDVLAELPPKRRQIVVLESHG